MTKTLLPYIDDKNFREEVKTVLSVAQMAVSDAEQKLYSNTIDPFSALFDAQYQQRTLSEWLQQEKVRQIQKRLQNAIGRFHQAILGHVPGWRDLGTGGIIDLKHARRKIIAEIKNKHNTTKGNHRKVIYDDLEGFLNTDCQGYVAYYVEIIPKTRTPYNKPFTPPDNETGLPRPKNDAIRIIDGYSFYALATGRKNALGELYAILPKVIAEITEKDHTEITADPLYTNLFKKAYPFST